MAAKQVTIKDFMRGREKKITIRWDPEQTITLDCFCDYYNNGSKTVVVSKLVEELRPDGTWQPYPIVTWHSGGEQLQTYALIIDPDEPRGLAVKASTNGVPDGQLMTSAKDAGLHTEDID